VVSGWSGVGCGRVSKSEVSDGCTLNQQQDTQFTAPAYLRIHLALQPVHVGPIRPVKGSRVHPVRGVVAMGGAGLGVHAVRPVQDEGLGGAVGRAARGEHGEEGEEEEEEHGEEL
jgi:hypothetical protein